MTQDDIKAMAAIVRSILRGKWTDDAPEWADEERMLSYSNCSIRDANYSRAVQTAETFIILCVSTHYALDEAAFLKECGLTR